jgi:hypothetical protein
MTSTLTVPDDLRTALDFPPKDERGGRRAAP